MKRLALLVLLSCGRVDIDVADPPQDFCSADRDCHAGEVCDKGCGQPTGHCRVKLASCAGVPPATQCGCDGVKYDNECERLHADAGFSQEDCH